MLKPLREPLLLPAVALGVGILASHWIDFATSEAIYGSLWLAFLCLFAWRRGLIRAARMAGVAMFLFLGIWTERHHRPGALFKLDANPDEVMTIEGCVIRLA